MQHRASCRLPSTNWRATVNSKPEFARLLDLLAIDQDDMVRTAGETAAHMTDFEAVKVADLICDFYYDLE